MTFGAKKKEGKEMKKEKVFHFHSQRCDLLDDHVNFYDLIYDAILIHNAKYEEEKATENCC